MHLINKSDLEKISANVFNNLSTKSNPSLTIVKESILNALGYKNLHAFQQAAKNDNKSGLLKYFSNQEIVDIVRLNIHMDDKSYSDFENFIEDLLLKTSSFDDEYKAIFIKKLNYLKFLNENNFTFFNYRWFKQSNAAHSQKQTIRNTGFTTIRHLDLWDSIKQNNTLASISLYQSNIYTEHFLEERAVERQKVYTVYDFIKSSFISIKKPAFFKVALNILETHYTLLKNISEDMDNIRITNYATSNEIEGVSSLIRNAFYIMDDSHINDNHYNRESETSEHFLCFRETHLNKIAKLLTKNSFSLDQIHDNFNKLLISNRKMKNISPVYDFDEDIKARFYSFRGDIKAILNERKRNIIIKNLSNNIILANEKVLCRKYINGIGDDDLIFKDNVLRKEYYKHFVNESITNKEHFYSSWLTYDSLLFIYLHFYLSVNKEMRVSDFIYFCDNFITDPDLMDIHLPIVATILANEYSSFLSDSFFK